MAGSDTTSSATRLTLLYLMTCPRVYYKLKGVIAEAIREGKVSNPISQAEARKIPYLQVSTLSCRRPFRLVCSGS